jgi:hypothetical protein
MNRLLRFVLLPAWLVCSLCAAESLDPSKQSVAGAQAAATRALAVTQGDATSARRAQGDFTPQGWTDFNTRMAGWLDEHGAPTFSETFAQAGPPLDLRDVDGVLTLKLPGILEQESRNAAGGLSSVRYRVEVEVEFVESSQKIRRLAVRTCGGAATKASCR